MNVGVTTGCNCHVERSRTGGSGGDAKLAGESPRLSALSSQPRKGRATREIGSHLSRPQLWMTNDA
jgi:hypothetical protein